MEWPTIHLDRLESIDFFSLNDNQRNFYLQMEKFARMGIIPSKKQKQFLRFLSKQNANT